MDVTIIDLLPYHRAHLCGCGGLVKPPETVFLTVRDCWTFSCTVVCGKCQKPHGFKGERWQGEIWRWRYAS